MALKRWAIKHENCIASLIMTAALFLTAAAGFGFYYDLNDDVLIKDVLSGVYTGTPDGHTMQLLYPLGFILSLLYRILSVPVFGIFLCGCQFLCIFLIGMRSASFCKSRRSKAVMLAAEGVFFAGTLLKSLVFIQYTVTSGLLACAAIFLVLTSDSGKEENTGPVRAFLKTNALALVLYWISFCLRSEMALLLLPLAGCAGLCRWGRERRAFAKETVQKYVLTFAALAGGMLLCAAADQAAYSQDGWPAFRQFFDDRTQLYDYRMDFIRGYEENRESYEELGISKSRHALLENYNFGVDDTINTELMGALRSASLKTGPGLFKKTLSEGLWMLIFQHLLSPADFPYNIAVLVPAALAFCAGLMKGRRRLLWQLPLCMGTGCALWLFLLMRDRYPERITVPLYLALTVISGGLLLTETAVKQERMNKGPFILRSIPSIRFTALTAAAVTVAASLYVLPGEWKEAVANREERDRVNAVNEAVYAYARANPSRLFLEDVYSTVRFSEKIMLDRDKPFNLDLPGGWLVKSPLTAKKLSAFGFTTMGEAARAKDSVAFLTEKGKSMDWLADYFEETGVDAQLLKVGTIADAVDIYQAAGGSVEEYHQAAPAD